MKLSDWEDKGKILSFVELQAVPQGLESDYNMALVELDKDGPKIICWSTDTLKVDDEVVVSESKGKYLCSPFADAAEKDSEPD